MMAKCVRHHDNCLSGRINWNSNAVYDRDGDGCADTAGSRIFSRNIPVVELLE